MSPVSAERIDRMLLPTLFTGDVSQLLMEHWWKLLEAGLLRRGEAGSISYIRTVGRYTGLQPLMAYKQVHNQPSPDLRLLLVAAGRLPSLLTLQGFQVGILAREERYGEVPEVSRVGLYSHQHYLPGTYSSPRTL